MQGYQEAKSQWLIYVDDMVFRTLFICLILPSLSFAQRATKVIKNMKQVHFTQPVIVLFHLDVPVKNAEYKLIINKSIIPSLDTLSYTGLLHHPEIYFAKIYTSSVPGQPYRKYYITQPETAAGIYPFGSERLPFEKVIKPPHGKLYSRKEPAKPYSTWLAQNGASSSGYDGLMNTLPGVDSVRVIYIIKKREKWKRKHSQNWVK